MLRDKFNDMCARPDDEKLRNTMERRCRPESKENVNKRRGHSSQGLRGSQLAGSSSQAGRQIPTNPSQGQGDCFCRSTRADSKISMEIQRMCTSQNNFEKEEQI